MTWEIRQGDALALLRGMPDASVQCCVTSPPYWGLRDYGTGTFEGGTPECDHKGVPLASSSSSLVGYSSEDVKVRTYTMPQGQTCRKCGARRVDSQMGLEATPEEYVSGMVALFSEVRRVLSDDGTLWLNLGSSYFGNPGGPQGETGDRATRTFTAEMRGTSPSRSRRQRSVPACGNDGTTPQDLRVPDSACCDLCDGCRAALSMGIANTVPPLASGASPLSLTCRGSEQTDSAVASRVVSPLSAQASTTQQSSPQPLGACSHCGNCGACLEVLRSSSRDARLCARMVESRNGSGASASDARNPGMDASGMAWVNYTSKLKPKDMVPTPWMVAMALQADGWYLRSDIIWHKPNPMPESVTDRPTKAHEYLFLLAKSERYFYDAAAIAEAATGRAPGNVSHKGTRAYAAGDEFHRTKGGLVAIGARDERNRRSVWTITSEPFAEAHFAVMPQALVEPCVLAGSRPRDTVLDPFAGSGTVGVVALRHGRNFVGLELNPEYAAMARRRIAGPLFAEHTDPAHDEAQASGKVLTRSRTQRTVANGGDE